MATYNNVAELRADLTADDPDQRATAYGEVLQADLEVSEVLSRDPPVEALAQAGIVPEPDSVTATPAAETRQKQVEVLEEIRDILTTQNGGTQ